jgi:polyhydroxybutyrate depolymerase
MRFLIALFILFSLPNLNAQINGSINHEGQNRTFVYYKPSSWTSQNQMPLLIVLHGLTQTGPGVMDITNFNQIAEQNDFIVCYPNGISNAWNANMNITVSTADDLGFIESLATFFQTNFNTNPLKQYLCGFSNGGFMSHKIACESSMCFAAIATVAGNMSDTTYANCSPQFSPAVLHIHGTADAVVPYNGGSGTGVSVDQTIQKWASFLTCDASPTIVNMSNPNLTDLSSPERITYANCTSSLELIKITGGGHQWPGIATLVGGAGVINMDFYSPEIIWTFLSDKSCPVSSLENIMASERPIFPNPVLNNLQIDSDQTHEYIIYDSFGFRVENGLVYKTLDVSKLAAGIYILKIKNDSESKSYRFRKD